MKSLNIPLVVLIMVTIVGCGARVEIAKEKALAKIDALLGTMDVKRREIDHGMRALKDSIGRLSKTKIEAQVKLDQLERKVAPIDEKIASIDQSLKKLRDDLASGEAVEIAGRSYSPDELKQMTIRVLQARKDYVAQRDGLMEAEQSLQKVVATLERKQQEYEQRLFRLEGKIVEIDAKRTALNGMRDASVAMDKSETDLSAKVGQLEDKVLDLLTDVEADLRFETALWDMKTAELELNAVDAFLSDTKDPSDVLVQIDRVLDGRE